MCRSTPTTVRTPPDTFTITSGTSRVEFLLDRRQGFSATRAVQSSSFLGSKEPPMSTVHGKHGAPYLWIGSRQIKYCVASPKSSWGSNGGSPETMIDMQESVRSQLKNHALSLPNIAIISAPQEWRDLHTARKEYSKLRISEELAVSLRRLLLPRAKRPRAPVGR